jgi:hypothetical protein
MEPQGEVLQRLWEKTSSHIIYLNVMLHRDQEFAFLYYKFALLYYKFALLY